MIEEIHYIMDTNTQSQIEEIAVFIEKYIMYMMYYGASCSTSDVTPSFIPDGVEPKYASNTELHVTVFGIVDSNNKPFRISNYINHLASQAYESWKTFYESLPIKDAINAIRDKDRAKINAFKHKLDGLKLIKLLNIPLLFNHDLDDMSEFDMEVTKLFLKLFGQYYILNDDYNNLFDSYQQCNASIPSGVNGVSEPFTIHQLSIDVVGNLFYNIPSFDECPFLIQKEIATF